MPITDKILKTKKVKWKNFVFIQQENFKDMSEDAYLKLKTSIMKNGFVEVFKVWENKNKIYCLDGFHRCKVFAELEKEGVEVPLEFTANFIDCKNKKDASKLVLIYSSIYAKVTEEGLYEFQHLQGLDFAKLIDEIEIPNIDMTYFKEGYLEDGLPEDIPDVDISGEVEGEKEYLVIYFNNPEKYKEFKKALEIPGLNRQFEWEKLRTNFGKVQNVQDSDTK